MTFQHSQRKKRNLEIGSSERLLPIFETENRILKIGSCARALRQLKVCCECGIKAPLQANHMKPFIDATERAMGKPELSPDTQDVPSFYDLQENEPVDPCDPVKLAYEEMKRFESENNWANNMFGLRKAQ